jgi:hypothetical protein
MAEMEKQVSAAEELFNESLLLWTTLEEDE